MADAILLAGGHGERFESNIPKQYSKIQGGLLIDFSLREVLEAERVERLVIALEEEWEKEVLSEIRRLFPDKEKKLLGFSRPGRVREETILKAMEYLQAFDELSLTEKNDKKTSDGYILIHEAVRPFVTAKMIDSYIGEAYGYDGVIPVTPAKETLYLAGDVLEGILPRDRIVTGQAPEVFRSEKYLKAVRSLSESELLQIRGSSEPCVKAGMKIKVIKGSEENIKITVREDMEIFFERLEKGMLKKL